MGGTSSLDPDGRPLPGSLEASGQVFKAKYDVHDGLWNDVRANATWVVHRNVGLGAGYNGFFTRLDVDKPGYSGTLRWGYSGVLLFATVGFSALGRAEAGQPPEAIIGAAGRG